MWLRPQPQAGFHRGVQYSDATIGSLHPNRAAWRDQWLRPANGGRELPVSLCRGNGLREEGPFVQQRGREPGSEARCEPSVSRTSSSEPNGSVVCRWVVAIEPCGKGKRYRATALQGGFWSAATRRRFRFQPGPASLHVLARAVRVRPDGKSMSTAAGQSATRQPHRRTGLQARPLP